MSTALPDKMELAREVDESEANLPYSSCNSEERAFRRRCAVRYAKQQYEKKAKGEESLSVDFICNFFDVPRATLYDWLKLEKECPGAGVCGFKTGPKKKKNTSKSRTRK